MPEEGTVKLLQHQRCALGNGKCSLHLQSIIKLSISGSKVLLEVRVSFLCPIKLLKNL